METIEAVTVEFKSRYRVALMTVTQMDIGITALAGVLQFHGIPTMLINLQTDEYGDPFAYPESVVKETIDLLKDVEFVGISVHDLFFKRAIFMAEKIKSCYPDMIIILGGIHAEIYPDDCLSYPAVNAVCIGDGYKAILDVVTKWNLRDLEPLSNTLVKRANGSIGKPTELKYYENADLDKVPLPDYSYEHYWMLIDGKLTWIGEYNGVYSFAHHQIGHKNTFVVSFMTGCIHNCLYCNNWTRFLKHEKLAGRSLPRVRYKSPGIVVEELSFIKKHHSVQFLNIMDNDFFIRPLAQIKEFSELYRQRIGLPFYVMASPDTFNEKKLQLLISAGLVELNIGLQTVQRVNVDMYNRKFDMDDDQVIEMTDVINKYVRERKIDVFYDFIIFNAAMTQEDMVDMINFIRRIPTPFDQVSHHLTLGPEVELYHKFKDCNIVLPRDLKKMYESDYHEFDLKEYKTFPNLYLNLILEWMSGRHDEEYVGRITRDPRIFLNSRMLIPLKTKYPDIYKTLDVVAQESGDIRDFLLHEKTRTCIADCYEVLDLINSKLPGVVYTNQQNIGVYHD